MSFAEMIEPTALRYGQRHSGDLPLIQPYFEDRGGACWDTPIDRLDRKTARAVRTEPRSGQSTVRAQIRHSSTNRKPSKHVNTTATLLDLTINLSPVIFAALIVVAVIVFSEATKRQVWEIAIPAGLAAIGCGLVLLGVLKFKRHLEYLDRKRTGQRAC